MAKPDRAEIDHSLLRNLRHKLIISCQNYIETMIPAAVAGGAACLRVNGPTAVRFAAAKTGLPLLACNKMYFPNSDVYITPSVRSARSLIQAGAQMVAFDARHIVRPRQSVAEMVQAIHEGGCLAVADIATYEEGVKAAEQGADVVATTFSSIFSPQLIGQLADQGLTVLAEGQVDTPEKASQAIDSGAWCVCVGTAITRPHLIAQQFCKPLR